MVYIDGEEIWMLNGYYGNVEIVPSEPEEPIEPDEPDTPEVPTEYPTPDEGEQYEWAQAWQFDTDEGELRDSTYEELYDINGGEYQYKVIHIDCPYLYYSQSQRITTGGVEAYLTNDGLLNIKLKSGIIGYLDITFFDSLGIPSYWEILRSDKTFADEEDIVGYAEVGNIAMLEFNFDKRIKELNIGRYPMIKALDIWIPKWV